MVEMAFGAIWLVALKTGVPQHPLLRHPPFQLPTDSMNTGILIKKIGEY